MPARRLRMRPRRPAARPQADARVLLLTREEEKRLLQRLEQITSLADLRRLQDRMEQQLGIRLTIAPGPMKCARCAASPSWFTNNAACAAKPASPSRRHPPSAGAAA